MNLPFNYFTDQQPIYNLCNKEENKHKIFYSENFVNELNFKNDSTTKKTLIKRARRLSDRGLLLTGLFRVNNEDRRGFMSLEYYRNKEE